MKSDEERLDDVGREIGELRQRIGTPKPGKGATQIVIAKGRAMIEIETSALTKADARELEAELMALLRKWGDRITVRAGQNPLPKGARR